MAIQISSISRYTSSVQTQQAAQAAQYNKSQKVANNNAKEILSSKSAQISQTKAQKVVDTKANDSAQISKQAMLLYKNTNEAATKASTSKQQPVKQTPSNDQVPVDNKKIDKVKSTPSKTTPSNDQVPVDNKKQVKTNAVNNTKTTGTASKINAALSKIATRRAYC